uniref:Uncharacterized protein ycf33 n=1 Tax=Tolypiocladia glomerulata TaxID=860646 RepID=A0A1Z1MUN2_9FLOR|nr:hypothetical protein [Tolypiocladia glomerulata]ARW69817.1 hypothetical protein [Tolypiocladia glomerulata]
MTDFWINLYKFPRFLTSVIIGFFLTTFKPIFRLLKNKKRVTLFGITIVLLLVICYKILAKMTSIE